MTEDIVKRLRYGLIDTNTSYRYQQEAADEIEKLRADKSAWQGVQQGTATVVKQLEAEIAKLRAANLILQDKYLRLQHKLGRIGQVLEEPCAAKAAYGESDD